MSLASSAHGGAQGNRGEKAIGREPPGNLSPRVGYHLFTIYSFKADEPTSSILVHALLVATEARHGYFPRGKPHSGCSPAPTPVPLCPQIRFCLTPHQKNRLCGMHTFRRESRPRAPSGGHRRGEPDRKGRWQSNRLC